MLNLTYIQTGAVVGLGVWFFSYGTNRVWLMFKGIIN